VVEEDGVRRAGDREIHVGIVQHNVRRFAAELEGDLLQVVRRSLDDELAHFRGVRQRNLVDLRMSRERRTAGLAETGEHVEHTRRQPGFLAQLREAKAGERCSSASFNTTVQSVVSAGPSFHAAISSGKFHGK
jgi:hypothetical protein